MRFLKPIKDQNFNYHPAGFAAVFACTWVLITIASSAYADERKTPGWAVNNSAQQAPQQATLAQSTEADSVDAEAILESTNPNPDPTLQAEATSIAEPNPDADISSEQVSETADAAEDGAALEEALQTVENRKPDRTATIANRQLANDIDAMFSAIDEMLERADPFAPELGELYYSYANLLLQAAEFDDAQEAFTMALHIEKINHGIYSLEQRSALKGLFDTMYAQGKSNEFEHYLNRIIWIESQHEGFSDDLTYDLLLKAGNHYIDMFLQRPIAGSAGLELLRKANNFLIYAVSRHENLPMSEKLMPYGEIALANTLVSKILASVDKISVWQARQVRSQTELEKQREDTRYLAQSFKRAEYYLTKYLKKAHDEAQNKDVVTALLQLGDLNLLFQRRTVAEEYYKEAWQAMEQLEDGEELRAQMAEPVRLPAFNYALERGTVATKRRTINIPMVFGVGDNGKVTNIQPIEKGDANYEYRSSARRAARKLLFRPSIIDGELAATERVSLEVRVTARTDSTRKPRANS